MTQLHSCFHNKRCKKLYKTFNIPKQNIIFKGCRNATNELYITILHNTTKHAANKVDHLPNATTKNVITFLYLAAFTPAISTLTKAIQKGILTPDQD